MEELLSKLAELAIHLEARGSELDIYDPHRALTDELLSDIKSNKPGLLELLKDMHAETGHERIPVAGKKESYALSYAQNRLYFLYQFDASSTAYNMPRLLKLEGDLDRDRLNETFRRLIDRHASLRTSFHLKEEGPVQLISPEVAFNLEEIPGDEATDPTVFVHAFVRPFDLGVAPLLRAGIAAVGEKEYVLILDMHHIIADGISQGILVSDFIALYQGKELPEPELEYADYAQWQQSPVHLAESAAQKEFWIRQFTPPPPPLELPADHPRPAVMRYAGNSLRDEIGEAEAERLKKMAVREEATLFMVLLSVYTILLAKLCNRDDIVVGSPTGGRQYPGLSDVVGVFINMLPLRHRPESSLTFREYLSRVKLQTLVCLDNQDYPYEELVDALKLERDASRNPLFDVVFDFAGYDRPAIQLPGLSIGPVDIISETAKFDLMLSATLKEDRILLNLEYSTDLFLKATIERFMGYFRKVLSSVISDPGIKIGDIGILPEKEERQLLVDFNDTGLSFAADATIVSLFEEQVRRTPDKTAVVFENEALTYRELHERANRLASYLHRQKALGPGDIVGLMAGRSLTLITALLGILKSGAAYLPIDPAYPKERVEYMLADSGAGILLVDKLPHDDLLYTGTIVQLDTLPDWPGDALGNRCKPEDLCYLIYTSGSTGKPKGVMIRHRNVVNFMEGLSSGLPVKEDDCMLAVTSTSFDISVLELFWTLCKGVEVVIHPADISLSNLDRYLSADVAVDFSLLFFSSYNHGEKDKYRLLLESAKYADKEGFAAVWTPERHFHEFGGLYPNPSVTSAALAMITERIALRCGSVVSPLHDPLRIAEEWSVVDNLSKGRVGLSFAAGWNPHDFAFKGSDFANRGKTMYEQIDTVQQLWKGGTIRRTNGLGKEVDVRIFPEPVQSQLPVWVTSGGTEETFKKAGVIGANLLTHLLGQNLEELAGKIKLYRESRKQHGHAGKGIVTIMLHTYVGNTIAEVEKVVEQPFVDYLKSSIGLTKLITEETGSTEQDIPEERKELILKNAFQRYYKTGALIGTKTSCSEMIRQLAAIDIDEIACLIDFGVETELVLKALKNLNGLKGMFTGQGTRAHRPVTMMQSTPSFIKMVREGTGSKRFLESLRTLLLGGEALPISLVRKLREETAADIHNMYGPTETTIWSCMHTLEQDQAKVLVGRPMANTQIYILNMQLQAVPLGVPGDLYIGGEGLSAGYWRRPELTSEKFIVNPYDREKRIYKTGDIGRWMPDGTIELLGREDHQVKIRGFRIEPGEIENLLSGYEGIQGTVVLALERGGDKFLTAYYVAEKEVPAEELRRYLAGKLPEYMVPAYFMHLPVLPLTPNGKIDRKALPHPEVRIGSDYVAPADETEEQLTGLWSEILKIDRSRISVTEDFFRLGGHSLNAMIAIARMEKLMGKTIPLKTFYGISTIRDTARYITKQDRKSNDILPAPQMPYYPLSSQQKRMYFMHKLDGTSLAYNETGIYVLHGELDTTRLSAAFGKLVERHEPLRTVFEWIDDGPVQRILPTVAFQIEDLQADADEEQQIKDLIRPFDLQRAPLMRVGIIERKPDEHLLIVDMHHIITDGISKGILVRDFMALYEEMELPAPALHYKDYVHWQLSQQQQHEIARQKTFWLTLFAMEPALLDLPADLPRPAAKTYRGKLVPFALDRTVTERLRSLAQEERTTVYMILMALFNVVLAKWSNQEDIVIGTPTAGRRHADLEKVVGMFVDTLPLRNYPRGELSFRNFLRDVRTRTTECFDNQAYPYDELIDELKVEREPGRNPLFDVFFVFHNFDMFELKIPGLALNVYEQTRETSKFDLVLEVFEKENDIVLNVEYATELFLPTTVDRFIAGFRNVVDAVISDVDGKIAGITLLTPEEEELVLKGFNDTKREYPREETIVSVFERQVVRTPQHLAFRYGAHTATYSELKERSDRIAAYLREAEGVRTGDHIGVMLERDERLIPAIFGILKAGGVYVPIDPKYPLQRIQAIAADAKLKVLLTKDSDWQAIWSQPAVPVDLPLKGGDLAYIIHTSGSTGRPKGVMIEHHSVINRLYWMQKEYPIGPGDVLLQKTPIVFDVSIWELFWWSFTGASLCLLEPDAEKEPEKINQAIGRNGVTVIHFVPSMLTAWLSSLQAEGDKSDLRSLRLLFTSGEALKASQVRWFNETLGRIHSTRLVNLYGPTEATVDVTFYECASDDTPDVIPIGKPIDNTRMYILDKHHRPVPIGVPGELYIAGAGLARGYLNDTELTDQKFTNWRERIYRTGDLARWMPDGNILFLGRIDHQVKIRGFRIEPEEIEELLLSEGRIKEAAVIARPRHEEKYLVAYYVSENALDARELRNYLADRLPGYMVPAFYVQLTEFPLNSNGKLNRKALPDLAIEETGGYIAASGGIEEQLVEIWAEVLRIEKDKLSTDTDFFEIGGHSIKAIQLMEKVCRTFSVEAGLRTIFEYPTIQQLAQWIAGSKPLQTQPDGIPSVGDRAFYTASAAQEQLYFEHLLNPDRLTANISFGYAINGEPDPERIDHALHMLLDRHAGLRTGFLLREDGVVQFIDARAKLTVTELDARRYATVAEVFTDFIRPFELSRPPLMRCGLLQHPTLGKYMFVDIHHIVCDGVSLNILMNDFKKAYTGAELTPLTLRYVDYADWQKQQGDSLQEQEAFWEALLKGPLPGIGLPVLRDRETADIYPAARQLLTIDADRYQKITQLTAAAKVSDFIFLLSIYYLFIAKASGRTDIIIGTDAMGRTEPSLAGLVGTFVNVLPLRLQVPREDTYAGFLVRVRDLVLSALERQDIPFDRLGMSAETAPGHRLVEVYFSYRRLMESQFDLSELQFMPLPIGLGAATTRYELELDAEPDGDRLQLTFLYSTGLYDEQTIGLFVSYYNNLLTAVLDDPNLPLETIL